MAMARLTEGPHHPPRRTATFTGRADKPKVKLLLAKLEWLIRDAVEEDAARRGLHGRTIDPAVLRQRRVSSTLPAPTGDDLSTRLLDAAHVQGIGTTLRVEDTAGLSELHISSWEQPGHEGSRGLGHEQGAEGGADEAPGADGV
eukprot:1392294-Prymnesium_polylepis.2